MEEKRLDQRIKDEIEKVKEKEHEYLLDIQMPSSPLTAAQARAVELATQVLIASMTLGFTVTKAYFEIKESTFVHKITSFRKSSTEAHE